MNRQIKQLTKKSGTHEVSHLWGRTWKVKSGSSGRFYVVYLDRGSCSCEWGSRRRPSGCSHFIAALNAEETAEGYNLTARPAGTDVSNLHRRTVRDLEEDGILFTARKAPKKARTDADPETGEVRMTTEEINDLLFG